MSVTSRILDVMSEAPERIWRAGEVASAIGHRTDSVSGILGGLAKDGLLERVGRGQYLFRQQKPGNEFDDLKARVVPDSERVLRSLYKEVLKLNQAEGSPEQLQLIGKGIMEAVVAHDAQAEVFDTYREIAEILTDSVLNASQLSEEVESRLRNDYQFRTRMRMLAAEFGLRYDLMLRKFDRKLVVSTLQVIMSALRA